MDLIAAMDFRKVDYVYEPLILCLYGSAGTGKLTIANTIL